MSASGSHKYQQLKWVYSALSGLCAAYFLALFSAGEPEQHSIFLQLATIFFGLAFPIYTTFSVAHVFMHEMDIPVERCDQALKNPWIIRITKGSFVCISLAFMCLIGHYSISVMFGFIVVSVLCFMSLARFLRELDSPASGK